MTTHVSQDVSALKLAVFASFGAISINIIVPIIPNIMSDLFEGETGGAYITAFFTFGFAVGHLLLAIFAQRMGHKNLLYAALIAFSSVSVLAYLATSANQVFAIRFFQGCSAGFVAVLGRTLVLHGVNHQQAAKTLSDASAMITWSPVLAPLLAVFIVGLAGWNSVFAVLAVLGLCALMLSHRIPESRFLPTDQEIGFLGDLKVCFSKPSFCASLLLGPLIFAGAFAYFSIAVSLDLLWLASGQAPRFSARICGHWALGFQPSTHSNFSKKKRPETQLTANTSICCLIGVGRVPITEKYIR
ncbi:MAG: MFS transporter [Henriciella sp.]|nr:MFS transporter [Henriciella sp.]